MDNVLSAIQENKWEEALKLFMDTMAGRELDENACIIGATIL